MKSVRTMVSLALLGLLGVGLSFAQVQQNEHVSVLEAREKFEKQVEAAVAPVRGRYVSELKSLKTKLMRENDLQGVAAVEAELTRLDEIERLWERHVLEGFWQVEYSNGTTRTYQIANTGAVRFIEEDRAGRIYLYGNDHLLEFGDGKVERLTLQPTIKLEHFNPKSRYPLGSPTETGVGVPTRR
jgi:hypothetical protein